MEKHLKDIFKKAKGVVLEKSEKADVRRLLVAYTETHPVRESTFARLGEQRSQKFAFTRTMPIVLVLLLLVGGGTAVAAQGALPGDVLYPVKTEINEGVRGWFAVGTEAKAKLDADLAVRRLEEAEELAASGELTEELKARLEARFEERAERAENRIAELEAEGKSEAAAELSSRLEAALEAHEDILTSIDERAENIASILARVRARIESAAEAREEAEIRIRARVEADVETAAERMKAVAEKRIADVRQFMEERRSRFGASALARAEAELELADEAVAEGEARLEAEAYGEALRLFQAAFRNAERAHVILATSLRLSAPGIPDRFPLRLDADIESDTEGKTEADAEADADADAEVEAGAGTDMNAGGDGASADVEAEGGVKIGL